jgi:hypothetical protein
LADSEAADSAAEVKAGERMGAAEAPEARLPGSRAGSWAEEDSEAGGWGAATAGEEAKVVGQSAEAATETESAVQ